MTVRARLRRATAGAAALGALGALASAGDAYACATCGCGDPTLTALGVEKPYQNRVRASIEGRYRTDRIGAPNVDEINLHEQRIDVQGAWAPHERVFLLLTVPIMRREVSYVNLARKLTLGLGDVELRAKVFLYQDTSEMPRHLISAIGGVKFPTAPLQRDDTGKLLPIELQPGTGSVDPILGLSYAYFPRPWSAYASVQAFFPTKGTEGFRASAALRSTVAVQYQVTTWFAPRLAIDTRLDGKALEDGASSRDSSGFIGFLSPEVLVSPMTDLMLYASVRIPILQALNGYHREGAIYTVGAAVDF